MVQDFFHQQYHWGGCHLRSVVDPKSCCSHQLILQIALEAHEQCVGLALSPSGAVIILFIFTKNKCSIFNENTSIYTSSLVSITQGIFSYTYILFVYQICTTGPPGIPGTPKRSLVKLEHAAPLLRWLLRFLEVRCSPWEGIRWVHRWEYLGWIIPVRMFQWLIVPW